MYLNCYACGQPGHYSANCPTRDHGAHPPARAADRREPESNRPEAKPAPELVPASQRAQYDDMAPWAEWVRERMGWPRTGTEANEARLRAKAAEQVAESRAARHVMDS